jgi:hypothetical protein
MARRSDFSPKKIIRLMLVDSASEDANEELPWL